MNNLSQNFTLKKQPGARATFGCNSDLPPIGNIPS